MQKIITLIQRAQAGDAEAYGAIVSHFQDMAYGYAYAILGDFHLAQDAAQEAFIEAYQCLSTLREPFAFPAWLKRIVYKQCDRQTRGKHLAVAPLDTLADIESPVPGPAELAERSELAQRVRSAISELSVQQRVVTTLFYINGYSHKDIADFLEVPAKTVKSRLHASRSRLRERMIDMVEDEFKPKALPEDFTQETVEHAIARAHDLNKSHQSLEAEEILRGVIDYAPQNPDVLKELNRAVAQGRVYGQGRFDMLPELAEYGRIILQTVDDDYIHHELARTLMAIPAMPEAIDFLENWIARKGSNIERLGMLAWAKGCVADYDAAEALWKKTLALAREAGPDEILRKIPFIAFTLVDCFAKAKELPRAQRVGREAWDLCRESGSGEQLIWMNADGDWMTIFRLAQLDLREYCETVLAGLGSDLDSRTQAKALYIRNGIDEPDVIIGKWSEWVRERISAGEWALLKESHGFMLRGFEDRGDMYTPMQLAKAIIELMKEFEYKEAQEEADFWEARTRNPWVAVLTKNWEAAQEIARFDAEKEGIASAAWYYVYIAANRGTPLPAEVIEAIKAMDEDKLDLHLWYGVARETAVAGDLAKGFDALRKALSYWTNMLYFAADIWEADTYWGELRNHPEFKAAFDERRQRIGPIRGFLHYFPGW